MKLFSHCSAALLISGLAVPVLPSTPSLATEISVQLLARGGGGGGGRGGGGARGGSAAGGARGRTGFGGSAGSDGLSRGNTRPSGGWSNKVGRDPAAPSLNRTAANRGGLSNQGRAGRVGELNRDFGGNRSLDRDVNRNVDRNINRDVNRNISRDWNRNVNLNSVNLYPGWARPGWALARPWGYGWYGVSAVPAWGWWGARAAAWGLTTLTTAAVINAAVNDAVDDHVSYIVVPNSDYQLQYGTVAPQGSDGVTFVVTSNGSSYQLNADCRSGTLNGRDPNTAAEAELINAACQVAYGSA